jgi:transglutaminase-like putative cysteine protease
MSRARLRLLLRDLAAAAGFGAMAVSGQVPLWAELLFLVAFLLALTGRRPLTDSRASAAALLVAVVGLYAAVALGGMDLVVAACTTAALLTAQRILARPGLRTDAQVHLASLLMVAGGAALSADLLFALCLLLYTVLAIVAQTLSVVEEPGGGRLPPRRALVAPLTLGVLLSLAGALAFFVLFPRLSWNLVARHGTASLGAAQVGFGDSLRLGGSGVLKSNPRVVLRARLDPDPGDERLEAYWVGRRFDTFDGLQWSSSTRPDPARMELRIGQVESGEIAQQIELLPAYGTRTLVGLDTPVAFAGAEAHHPGYSMRAALVRTADEQIQVEGVGNGFNYRVLSARDRGSRLSSGTERERRLALPRRLDPRIARLAQQLASGVSTPRAIARRLERGLQSAYAYTLELPGPVPDPLADFLFQRRAGHCEDFATALAMLLRTQGIPSRVVVGFYGGERAAGEYLVRAGDAHAWVEAEVDGRVLRLDATPPQNRSAAGQGLTGWLLARWEALEIRWVQRVVDFSLLDQARLAGHFRSPGSQQTGERGRAGDGHFPFTVLASLGLVLLAAAAWRFSRPGSPAERLGLSLHRLLRASGRLGPSGWLDGAPVGDASLTPVRLGIARYREARFGRQPLDAGEARSIVRAARRALHRRPPLHPGATAPQR